MKTVCLKVCKYKICSIWRLISIVIPPAKNELLASCQILYGTSIETLVLRIPRLRWCYRQFTSSPFQSIWSEKWSQHIPKKVLWKLLPDICLSLKKFCRTKSRKQCVCIDENITSNNERHNTPFASLFDQLSIHLQTFSHSLTGIRGFA